MRWIVVIFAVIGGLFALLGLSSDSAPKMAAWAAMGCAFAVIPYVIFRASQLTDAENERREFRKAIIEKLQASDGRNKL